MERSLRSMKMVVMVFWEIPLSEWDDSCGFDIITATSAYYSHVFTKILKDIVERQKWTDEPFEVELNCIIGL